MKSTFTEFRAILFRVWKKTVVDVNAFKIVFVGKVLLSFNGKRNLILKCVPSAFKIIFVSNLKSASKKDI